MDSAKNKRQALPCHLDAALNNPPLPDEVKKLLDDATAKAATTSEDTYIKVPLKALEGIAEKVFRTNV